LHESGHAYNADPKPQLRWQEGSWVALATMNTSKTGVPRRGSAILLHERAHLRNLHVVTSAMVHRVLFDGSRASGVRVSLTPPLKWTSRKVVTVKASKGVIMAAGAIMTPQLLQMSGVGQQPLLDNLGVQQVADLPVGQNFIDRLVLTLGVKTNRRMPLSVGYAISVNTTVGLTFETEAGGQIASEFAIASVGLSSPKHRNASGRLFMKFLFRWPGGKPTPLANDINKMMQVLALQHSTHSRGKVEAQSLDPSVPPRVDANYYDDERDLMNQRMAAKELLKVAGTEALSDYVAGKVQVPIPDEHLADGLKCMQLGPSYRGHNSQDPNFKLMPCLPTEPASTQDWHDYLRRNIVSSYHYFGTASVGTVLETGDLRVKGLQGLHVIDASVFKDPPRINPQHLIMTVGHYIGSRLAKQSASQLEVGAGEVAAHQANASSPEQPGDVRRRRRTLAKGFDVAKAMLVPDAATA
jgi:choline dehydrogenase